MANFSRLGLIAGASALPERIAAAASGRGDGVYILRLIGFAEPALSRFPGEDVGLGEAGRMFDALRRERCDAVVLAGRVKRPNFAALKVDFRGVSLLPKVITAAARGDGALLDVLVHAIEAEGFQVIAPEDVLAALAVRIGPLGRLAPDPGHLADIKKGAALIDALGPFDVGQGAIIADGHVIAVEAAEGTDAMLSRSESLDLPAGRGVLVKRPKPGQERRVDLPAIGPQTVQGAARARLGGIAVEAGGALLIDEGETMREADRLGLFVFGFSQDAPSKL